MTLTINSSGPQLANISLNGYGTRVFNPQLYENIQSIVCNYDDARDIEITLTTATSRTMNLLENFSLSPNTIHRM